MAETPDEEKDMRLEAILDYEMNEMEGRAYRLTLLWMDMARKMFPDYQHAKLKKGDPRKSLLFKVCHTVVRKTQGILEERDYPLYVRAQLDILRHINIGKEHPLIDANCLNGEKAWKRWKLWKKKYDSVTKKPTDAKITAPEQKIVDALVRTKEFLTATLGAAPAVDRYREAVINKNLFRWINLGKISPYYLVLSPYIAAVVPAEELKKTNFDLGVYRPSITPNIQAKFKELFPHEICG